MNETETQLIKQLVNLMAEPEYFEFESHSVIEEMKECEDQAVFVEPIFRIMESAPTYNFGNPGSIVHFIEATDGYEAKLIESLQRQPSMHGIILLNRILNRAELKNRRECINVLKNIVQLGNTTPEIVKFANSKLSKHTVKC